MNSVVGFTIFSNLPENRIKALQVAQDRALAYFALQRRSLVLGETYLEVWGRKGMKERIHTLHDGSLVVVIGSPHGKVVSAEMEDNLLSDDFAIPWDGRVIILRVSADGRRWTMWNDWLGSIPVFHAEVGGSRIASTLEPVTVAAGGFSSDDFYLPGLVSLLINGHFISDWTLFKGMKTVPPDCVAKWAESGFHSQQLWTVKPTEDRWEASWDDLVDEMHELSGKAIADVLKTQPNWILPLSAGLDSRLIAAVGADLGVNFHAYAWGEPESTDVIYSHQIAKTLDISWKRIELCKDFLECYTPLWADLFGSSMHFHGMYQMCFLDAIKSESDAPLITGYIGDMLSGMNAMQHDTGYIIYKKDWYMHWDVEETRSLLKIPIDEALQEIAEEVKRLVAAMTGGWYSKSLYFALWSRQRLFTSFQSTVSSYWRGTATPFLNRAYARFCISLPRAVHENRHLLADVFRRYYGRLAVIPGTYASQPFILTGKYLLKHRIVEHLPASLHHGPFAGFDDIPLRMDVDCIRATGKKSLWPMYNAWDQLGKWLDVSQLEPVYQAVMSSAEDIRPLRKLQSIQALAYRLLNN